MELHAAHMAGLTLALLDVLSCPSSCLSPSREAVTGTERRGVLAIATAVLFLVGELHLLYPRRLSTPLAGQGLVEAFLKYLKRKIL